MTKPKGLKILIVGGAGFIGSHVADALCKDNYVIVVDDFSYGKIENIEHLLREECIKLIKGSILDEKTLDAIDRACPRSKLDIVIHQAAYHLTDSIQNPILDLKVNALGTLRLLEHYRNTNVRFIYASTGSVYGEPRTSPQREDDPKEPVSPYGISKLAADLYVRLYFRLYGIEGVCLRYYNVYGPRQRKEGVIPTFILRVLKGQPPTIHGSGEQTRCFTYVSDVVDVTLQACLNDRCVGEAFNISSGIPTSIKELAFKIIKLCGKQGSLQPIHGPPRVGDIMHILPDISKAKKLLSFTPKVKLEDGLRKCIEWWSQYLKV